MSKELIEELLLPQSALHFASDGPVVRVRPQDVERDAANHAKVLWSVILPRSRVILVEHHIALPVQVVFHGPMLAVDARQAPEVSRRDITA